MVMIGVDQPLSNIALYEHNILEEINKVYKFSGRFDYRHKYKAILEAAMVSTNGGLTENIPISLGMFGAMKKSSAKTYFSPFSEVLDVEQKTTVCSI